MCVTTEKKDYSAQARYIKKNYVKFNMNLKPELVNAFKAACESRGTTATTEIKRFMTEYCAANNR
jgi:hypothetical protein